MTIAPEALDQTRQSIPAPAAYNKLTEEELALMDRINAARADIEKLTSEVKNFVEARDRNAKFDSMVKVPARSAALGITELQTGFMWLARAVARPNFF